MVVHICEYILENWIVYMIWVIIKGVIISIKLFKNLGVGSLGLLGKFINKAVVWSGWRPNIDSTVWTSSCQAWTDTAECPISQ